MPYRRHEPVDVSEMDRTRYDGHHSICQFIRDMYHLSEEIEDRPIERELFRITKELKLKLLTAMAMAKAMNQKLQDYKHEKEQEIARNDTI